MTEQSLIYSEVSFKDFLFKNRRNRTILWFAAAAIVIQFLAFKYFYPYASYIHDDSFAYIKAADKNLDVNSYLIGYSKFLRLFSVFNRTDYMLTAFQYLFIELSALYFLYTLIYFYKPRRIVQVILLCFIAFNPLFLHLSNLISSDGIFLSLSFTWFALLLHIIHRPTTKLIIWHAVVIFIAFTVRYNAIIYPVISALAFWFSNMSIKRKLAGLGFAAILIGSFTLFTMYKYEKLTGDWQYSPFSGWQLTNNAMYTYRYVNAADRKPVPKIFQEFNNMICEYFDSTRDVKKFPLEAIQASTYYMWSKEMPMIKYRDKVFKNDPAANNLKKWASMGPYFKVYGLYIIKQYPWHFIRYFLWPNAQKYYAPPLEFLEYYNDDKTGVTEDARKWFGYSSRLVNSRFESKKLWTLSFYPILSGAINVVMICCLLCYFLLKGWQYHGEFRYAVWMGGSIWLLNAGFTIGASSAALRFQAFPIIITSAFTALLLDWLVQVMSLIKSQETTQGLETRNTVETKHPIIMQ
ncbi:hypothetical protein A3860_31540 [Niastella vici]|uniref:Glycosyltransferase RgtA/B/C/D-like domain-containing protein n=1 Tax=Niastella vici TaxID=1703345 RepID=A0A1V9FTW3_9BACT|nr:DUF2142 domain-containing protein [Niastella vici]OQP61794.1 hypothetical protein A3860_31540 [Niastella vici]